MWDLFPDAVRRNVAIDWTVKVSLRAKLRVMVKQVLRRYGYPPDKQEKAMQTVLEQAELIVGDWALSAAEWDDAVERAAVLTSRRAMALAGGCGAP